MGGSFSDRKYNGLVEEARKNFRVDVRVEVEVGFTTPTSSNKKVTLNFSYYMGLSLLAWIIGGKG